MNSIKMITDTTLTYTNTHEGIYVRNDRYKITFAPPMTKEEMINFIEAIGKYGTYIKRPDVTADTDIFDVLWYDEDTHRIGIDVYTNI